MSLGVPSFYSQQADQVNARIWEVHLADYVCKGEVQTPTKVVTVSRVMIRLLRVRKGLRQSYDLAVDDFRFAKGICEEWRLQRLRVKHPWTSQVHRTATVMTFTTMLASHNRVNPKQILCAGKTAEGKWPRKVFRKLLTCLLLLLKRTH